MGISNDMMVEKYVSAAKWERDLNDIEVSMDASDAARKYEIVENSRRIIQVNDKLARWIVISSAVHVSSLAAIIVLAVR